MAFTTDPAFEPAKRSSLSNVQTHPRVLADLLHAVVVSIGYLHQDLFPFLYEETLTRTETEVAPSPGGNTLGSFTGDKTWVGSERLHRITVYAAHPSFASLPPDRRAVAFVSTLVHEATHLVAHKLEIEDTVGSGNRRHTEAFAEIAEALGLRIERRPKDPVGIYTPGLSGAGAQHMDDIIYWLTANLAALPSPTTFDVVGPHRLVHHLQSSELAIDTPTHVHLICRCHRPDGYPAVLRVDRTYRDRIEACSACRSRFLELHRLLVDAESHQALKAG